MKNNWWSIGLPCYAMAVYWWLPAVNNFSPNSNHKKVIVMEKVTTSEWMGIQYTLPMI